jgi:hypothetical protein
MSESKMLITPISLEDIELPSPKASIEQEKAQIKRKILADNIVVIESAAEGNSSCFTGVKFEAIKSTCGFEEDVDAQLFIAKQNDKNIVDGAIFTSALSEHIYEQAELNQGTSTGDEHLDTLACLNAVTDTGMLVTTRLLNNQENKEQWPALRNKIVGEQNSSGEDMDGHHIERQADNPEKTLERNNIVPKERQIHKSEHTKTRKQSADEMKNIKVPKAAQVVGKKVL